MCHDAAPKERVFKGTLRAVVKLIGEDDVAWLILRLQRPHCADTDDPLYAKFLHHPDIRAMVQLAGQDSMSARMARQEDDFAAAQLAGKQLVRRCAKGSFDRDPLLVCETIDVIKPTATNNPDAMR